MRMFSSFNPPSSTTRLLALLAPWAFFLAGCSSQGVEVAETRLVMNAEVSVDAIAPSDDVVRRAVAAAWKEMETCVALLDRQREPSSDWLKNIQGALKDPAQAPSDVWKINSGSGRFEASVDPIVTSCLAAAKEVNEGSGGAFDPTVGPLIDLWNKAESEGLEPSPDRIAAARGLVGLDKMEVLIQTVQKTPREMGVAAPGSPPPKPDDMYKMVHSVGLQKKGMSLDLGGIAKGYIAGRVAQRMKQEGAVAGYVSFAGCRSVFGRRPANLLAKDEDPRWTVAIPDPRDPEGKKAYTTLRLKDQAVHNSGWCYRGFAIGGVHYSHIIDPKSGRPVSNRIASVTVVAADPAIAQAMATAIAILGVKAGLATVAKYDDMECLILEVGPPEGSPEGTPPPAPDASGVVPPEATLIPHRSPGFAELESPPAGK
jgi:FAD:protein FMN transferase